MLTPEERNAARILHERFGKERLLDGSVMLSNALGDLLGADAKMLRSRLRMALDAGVARLYLERMDDPSIDFGWLVTRTLREECGFSHEVAADMKAFFDELCGVPATDDAVSDTNVPIPEPAPEPVLPQPVVQPPANSTVSMRKLYLLALLPFLAIVAYSILDRILTAWIYNNIVSGRKLPPSPYHMLSHREWYQYVFPLLLPYLLPLLTALVAMLIIRRRRCEAPRTMIMTIWFGALVALLSLVIGNVAAGSSVIDFYANSDFAAFLWRHYAILCFDFQTNVHFSGNLPFVSLPYLSMSLLYPVGAAFLAQRLSKDK